MRILNEKEERAIRRDVRGRIEETLYPMFEKYDLQCTPTLEGIKAAHTVLRGLVVDFPFVSRMGLAAWYAGVLTGVAGRAIPRKPMFAVSGPRGSGKSILAKTAALIAVEGYEGRVIMLPPAETKFDRRVGNVFILDNIDWLSKESQARVQSWVEAEPIERMVGAFEEPPKVTFWATSRHHDRTLEISRVHIELGTDDDRTDVGGFAIMSPVKEVTGEQAHRYHRAALTLLKGYVSTHDRLYPDVPIERYHGPLMERHEHWSMLVEGCVEWFTGTSLRGVT